MAFAQIKGDLVQVLCTAVTADNPNLYKLDLDANRIEQGLRLQPGCLPDVIKMLTTSLFFL